MIKKRLILLLAICVAFTPVKAWCALGDLGEPRSSYNLGSARFLSGNNVIVSVYADTPSAIFSDEDIASEEEKLESACEYIIVQGEKYGQDIIFTTKDTENTYLSYRIKLDRDPDESDEFENYLDEKMHFFNRKILGSMHLAYDGYERIKACFEADNIFVMVHFKLDGRAYAVCFDGEDTEYEYLVTYKDSEPSVLAHEMLHLYGAHDYYEGAEYTEDVVSYIGNKYPDDIMLRVNSGDRITKSVGKLTAYHLGWVDEYDAVKKYPQLLR